MFKDRFEQIVDSAFGLSPLKNLIIYKSYMTFKHLSSGLVLKFHFLLTMLI